MRKAAEASELVHVEQEELSPMTKDSGTEQGDVDGLVVVHLLSRQGEDSECPGYVNLGVLACSVKVYDQTAACAASPRAGAALGWESTHTSRAAVRPGTAAAAAVVKRSACLDCFAVSSLGSVVMPGSASFDPPKTA